MAKYWYRPKVCGQLLGELYATKARFAQWPAFVEIKRHGTEVTTQTWINYETGASGIGYNTGSYSQV